MNWETKELILMYWKSSSAQTYFDWETQSMSAFPHPHCHILYSTQTSQTFDWGTQQGKGDLFQISEHCCWGDHLRRGIKVFTGNFMSKTKVYENWYDEYYHHTFHKQWHFAVGLLGAFWWAQCLCQGRFLLAAVKPKQQLSLSLLSYFSRYDYH